MRPGRMAWFAAACLAAVASRPGRNAAAGGDSWTDLEDPNADAARLGEILPAALANLESVDAGSKSGNVTVYAREPAEREGLAKELDGVLQRAAGALRRIGYEAISARPDLVVVRVKASGVDPLLLSAPDLEAVLLREPKESADARPPELPRRPDGPLIARDLVTASDRMAVHLWRAAHRAGLAAGPGSLTDAVARHVVSWVSLPVETPPWLRAGLVAWVEAQASPRAKAAPLHLCGGAAATPYASARAVSDPKAVPTPASARLVGRVLGILVGDRTDAAERIAKVAASADKGESALSDAFGKPAAEALAQALMDAAGPAVACDGAGTLLCPICKGAGKVDVACSDCEGLGGVACPACGGDPACPSATCINGVHHYEGGKDVPCKFCNHGVYLCKACGGAGRMPCRVCNGSGSTTRPCLACLGKGRVPCPEGGMTPEIGALAAGAPPIPCPWCASNPLRVACAHCGGAGFEGCGKCAGATRVLCPDCGGTGEERMVYKDGTTASATKCPTCAGIGFSRCDACVNGKSKCPTCDGKGLTGLLSADCPACDRAAHMLDVAAARRRLEGTLGGSTADEANANAEMLGKAIRFLLTCTHRKDGAFGLREFRGGPKDATGKLLAPTLYSNADCVWTLAAAGIGKEDPRIAHGWEALRQQAAAVVSKGGATESVQAVSLAVRALVAGGEDPRGSLVSGLIDLLVRAQRPDGLWSDVIASADKGDAFHALFPIETFYLASRKGAKVPSGVWSKALSGALASFDVITKQGTKHGWVSGTDVASSTALVVLAKAGTLGARAKDLDSYRSMPAVQKGLAWLDRHFDVRREPVISAGAPVREASDAGYAAYLYAIQRLAQLLTIDVLGGERWHATGTRHLREIQLEDGAFEEFGRDRLNGPVRCTTSAILFLIRATPPLTQQGSEAEDNR